jgi:hypothetical protein
MSANQQLLQEFHLPDPRVHQQSDQVVPHAATNLSRDPKRR